MGQSFDVSTTVLEKSVSGTKLKIKILTKKPANAVDVDCTERLSVTDYKMPIVAANLTLSCDREKKPVNGRSQFSRVNCPGKMLSKTTPVEIARDSEKHKSITGTKRGPEELLDSQEGKKLKMDCIAASRCQNTLQKLMKHKFAKPFLEPVRPADWGIHDYFDIVKHPMDLGTIKQKLNRNAYASAEEFEADVRLTFSNAMLYNPSNNWVHQHAKRLGEVFDCDWKSVKAVLIRDQKNILKKRANNGVDKITSGVRGKCVESNSSIVDPIPSNTSLRNENDFDNMKNTSFREPDQQAVKDHEAKAKTKAKAKPSKLLRPNPVCAVPVFRSDKQGACSMSANTTCRNTNADKVSDKVNAAEVKITSTVQMTRSDPDSEGAVSCVDEEYAFASIPTSAGSFDSASQTLDTVLDMELSPSKALRAAKLRSRFADTILKAQNKTLLQPVGAKNSAILEQEKEKLLKKQQEERARIEAQVREAELAARIKAEGEQKKQRQQARAAARAALEKMERSITLDDNFHLTRDLEALLGTPLFVASPDSRRSRQIRKSPLERLGFYIKAEYRIGDDDDDEDEVSISIPPAIDLEEGEVPC